MTEQLYRVCWRSYWDGNVSVRNTENAPKHPIGDAYRLMLLFKYVEQAHGYCSDYWIEPA